MLSHKETLFSGLTQTINFTGISVASLVRDSQVPPHTDTGAQHNPGISSSSEPHYADQYRVRNAFKLTEKSIREEFNGLS